MDFIAVAGLELRCNVFEVGKCQLARVGLFADREVDDVVFD